MIVLTYSSSISFLTVKSLKLNVIKKVKVLDDKFTKSITFFVLSNKYNFFTNLRLLIIAFLKNSAQLIPHNFHIFDGEKNHTI